MLDRVGRQQQVLEIPTGDVDFLLSLDVVGGRDREPLVDLQNHLVDRVAKRDQSDRLLRGKSWSRIGVSSRASRCSGYQTDLRHPATSCDLVRERP